MSIVIGIVIVTFQETNLFANVYTSCCLQYGKISPLLVIYAYILFKQFPNSYNYCVIVVP